jgi:hypothetical protein
VDKRASLMRFAPGVRLGVSSLPRKVGPTGGGETHTYDRLERLGLPLCRA